jgi:hypothetical protein
LARSKLLLTILCLCLALVLVYLTMGYFSQKRSQNALKSQIDTATQTLVNMAEPEKNLDQFLQQAKDQNQAARDFVSGGNIDSTHTLDSVLKKADERHLKIDPLSTEQWSTNSVGSSIYRMLPMEFLISGTQSDFVIFVTDLENEKLFPSLVIENISVTRVGQPDLKAEAGITVKLTLSLVVRSKAAG